jgi:hypothetical protein
MVTGDGQPTAGSLLTTGTQAITETAKEEIYSAVQNEVEFIGDLNLQNALNSVDKIRSIDDLYDHVLNNVSLAQLTSIAIGVVQSAASIAGFNSSLCTEAFTQLSDEDIETIVRPCLEKINPDLWEKISNVKSSKFDSINATIQDIGMSPLEKQDWKELEDLYCQYPKLKEALNDKGPSDLLADGLQHFIDLIATAEEEAQICECMADNFLSSIKDASMEELFEMAIRNGPIGIAAGAAAGVVLLATGAVEVPSIDEMFEAGHTGIKTISQERMDVDLDKFTLPTTDFIGDLPENFESQLKQTITEVLIGLVGMVLDLVKKRIMGDSTTDLENAIGNSLDPFGFSNISDLVMNSPTNNATDRWGTSHKLSQVSKNSGVNFNSDDEANNFFNEISVSFSPSELSRMFKDLSIDAVNNRNYRRVIAIVQANYANSVGATVKTISQVRELFANVGGLIDDSIFNNELARFNALKRSVADICEEGESDIVDQLSDMLSNKDILDQLKKEKENNLEKGKRLLDLLNGISPPPDGTIPSPNKPTPSPLDDLIPPLFCDPCNPSKKPIMNSQLHPSQQHLNDSVNLELYKGVQSIFNNEIDNYKPIILEVQGAANNLILGIPAAPPAAGEPQRTNLSMLADLNSKPNEAGVLVRDVEGMKTILSGLGIALEALDGKNVSQFVAPKLRENLKQSFDNINSSEPTPHIKLLSYSVQNYRLDLAFNLSDEERTYNITSTNLSVKVDPQSYKITVIDISNIVQGYIHIVTEQQAGSSSETSVEDPFKSYLSQLLDPYRDTVFTLNSTYENNIIKLFLPTLEVLLESTLIKTAETNLFESAKFNSLQLKSSPISCGPPEEGPTLLNVRGLRDEVSELANKLQCYIPYDVPPGTPSVIEMSNIIGIIKLTLRVFVIEEYLKNIFIFSLYKMSDIVKNDVYMNFVIEKVYASLGSSDIYTNLQNYSLEAINLLRKTGENIPQEIATPQDAIRYLVRMTAEDVSNTLDTRIQEQIYSQEEKSQFLAFEGVEAEAVLEAAYIGRFLKYVLATDEIQSPNTLRPRIYQGALEFQDMYPTTLDENFNGGFIFQEYVQITSKFASSDGQLKFNQKIEAAGAAFTEVGHNIDSTLLAWISEELKTDKHYRFLVRPGTVQEFKHENQHVWSNPSLNPSSSEAQYGWQGTAGKWMQFLYRGKCDINRSLTYYTDLLEAALIYTNNKIDYYNSTGAQKQDKQAADEFVVRYQIIKWILSNMAYTDWFEPLKYGMRLMLMIPVPENFDASSILHRSTIDEDSPNYSEFLEDKIFSYSNYLTGQKMLAFPVVKDAYNVTLTQGTSLAGPLIKQSAAGTYSGAFHTALNFAGGWNSGQVNEMRGAAKREIYKQLQNNNNLKNLLEDVLPVKGLVLMTALYHRAEMEALYPELATLFNGTKKTVADLFAMQLAAINRDYGFETDLLSSADPSDQLAGMGIDYGAIIFNFLQIGTGAAATVMDPTWTTPWFFPGPTSALGYVAKILNMIDIDFGGAVPAGGPAMLAGGKLYDPAASKCEEQEVKSSLAAGLWEEDPEEEDAPPSPPPPPVDPPPEPEEPPAPPVTPKPTGSSSAAASEANLSWFWTVAAWHALKDDGARSSEWYKWNNSEGGVENFGSAEKYVHWPGGEPGAGELGAIPASWPPLTYHEINLKFTATGKAPPPPGWHPTTEKNPWIPGAQTSLDYIYSDLG